jgi:acyl dehydratase
MPTSVPVFRTAAELRLAVGNEFGPSDWLAVTQDRIDAFAAATGDHHWIHVDPQRAQGSALGATIAHGYLTLALIPYFLPQLFRVTFGRRLNYGSNRVRYPEPVRCGTRIRARAMISELASHRHGLLLRTDVVIEAEGRERPACTAQTLRFIEE